MLDVRLKNIVVDGKRLSTTYIQNGRKSRFSDCYHKVKNHCKHIGCDRCWGCTFHPIEFMRWPTFLPLQHFLSLPSTLSTDAACLLRKTQVRRRKVQQASSRPCSLRSVSERVAFKPLLPCNTEARYATENYLLNVAVLTEEGGFVVRVQFDSDPPQVCKVMFCQSNSLRRCSPLRGYGSERRSPLSHMPICTFCSGKKSSKKGAETPRVLGS